MKCCTCVKGFYRRFVQRTFIWSLVCASHLQKPLVNFLLLLASSTPELTGDAGTAYLPGEVDVGRTTVDGKTVSYQRFLIYITICRANRRKY